MKSHKSSPSTRFEKTSLETALARIHASTEPPSRENRLILFNQGWDTPVPFSHEKINPSPFRFSVFVAAALQRCVRAEVGGHR
jgi:hypothetical protein